MEKKQVLLITDKDFLDEIKLLIKKNKTTIQAVLEKYFYEYAQDEEFYGENKETTRSTITLDEETAAKLKSTSKSEGISVQYIIGSFLRSYHEKYKHLLENPAPPETENMTEKTTDGKQVGFRLDKVIMENLTDYTSKNDTTIQEILEEYLTAYANGQVSKPEKKKKQKPERVTGAVRLDEQIIEKLNEVAESHDLSVQYIIEEYLKGLVSEKK